ncbi:MAG TPA: hypothetical protein VGJ96_13275 [Gemmatimonadaceae bacterium]|jgi:hypothetical protein
MTDAEWAVALVLSAAALRVAPPTARVDRGGAPADTNVRRPVEGGGAESTRAQAVAR